MKLKPAPITVKILKDSITDDGSRLVTQVWVYPRNIHAEIMTHRDFSRNAASSRAIPAGKLRANVLAGPSMTVHWGQNQKGMQADTEIFDTEAAEDWWWRGLEWAARHHEEGEKLGLHKQVINRIIEPWMMISTIVSLTNHANFFHLRKHKDAEPNFKRLADCAWEQFMESTPTYLAPGEWHRPYCEDEDVDFVTNSLAASDDCPNPASIVEFVERQLCKISVGRCARVSYLTHEGKRDPNEDIGLHDKLARTASLGEEPMHASPFEHVAVAMGGRKRFANFEGWKQYRSFFAKENGPDTSNRCNRCGLWTGEHTRGCPAR